MANETFKTTLTQNGIVLSKFIKEATSEFVIDGRKVPPQPKRFFVKVVTGTGFSQENGYAEMFVTEYKILETLYMRLKYGTPVVAEIEVSNYGAKGVSVNIKN